MEDWERRYQDNDTPWDLGQAAPALAALTRRRTDLFESKTVLVPGCGRGHDALEIASVGGEVTGLDLSRAALRAAEKLDAEGRVRWVAGDFLNVGGGGKYEVVWEHTCFCAIPVERRPDYARAASEALPQGGLLIGIFFLNPDVAPEDGPPFGTDFDELERVFGQDFDREWLEENPPAVPDRAGREALIAWRKR